MRVTLAQISPKLNRTNLDDIIKIINSVKDSSDLIVFPELSLSGYMLQDKLSEDAWQIEELDELRDLSKEIDIVVGAAFKDESHFRNAALYFSKGECISRHNKVYLPNYGMFEEARYFEAGDIFESFSLDGKSISMVICEDLWHKNVHQDLIEKNPDIIIALVASPARGFSDDGLEIQRQWYDIIKTVAKECSAKLIFVNRVGFEDGLGFWGGSCTVDVLGNIQHQQENFKKIIKTVEV
ncbi:MAG: Glutamine-dependent NAD(+) synthetase [uncultured Sulfurimonas sp.]|nr:MAG: Glutamine-dependent NAD(+) synthetase [uncultured Sulfurimonas sp.]CAI6156090.1 MAG: Glutamine-dependent NAD(+) synthetase [uncultured Sulfurimonas sp.]